MCRIVSFLAVLAWALAAGCATTGQSDRRSIEPLHGQPGDIVVLIFGAVDCPIANRYAPTLAAIQEHCSKAATSTPVRMYYVYPASHLDQASAEAHAKEYGLTIPIVLDSSHAIVDAVGATVTPEAAVLRFESAGTYNLAYRGRIDDWYLAIGQRRTAATQHDLLDAIDATVAGRPVSNARTAAIGCFIER